MVRVQFISVQTLKDKSVLQDNVDEKILNLAIREYQELELEPILGETEYLRLEDAVLASVATPSTPLSEDDNTLFKYIIPVMVYGSLMYSISPIHRKLSNGGVKVDATQNSVSDDLAAARADHAFKTDGYKRKLIKYITDKQAGTATDLTKCKNVQDTTFTFSGIILPDVVRDFEKQYQDTAYKSGGAWGRIIR